MANPSSVGVYTDWEPAIVEVTTTASSVTVDSNKQYMLQHNGINTSGTAVTDVIQIATDDSTAALTAGAGQAILLTSNNILVGPGITTLKFDVGANAPTMTVIPLFDDKGDH